MQPPHASPTRTRAIALALAASLAIVAVLWRFGVPDAIIYGLAGGFVACLIIIGLDRLHSVERRMNDRDETTHDPPPREEGR